MSALISKEHSLIWWIIAIVLIIGIGALASVTFEGGKPIGVNESTSETIEGENAFWNVLFHPKVLGMAVILLIAMFTVSKLAGKAK